jgi:hypothetical protein
VQEQAAAQLFRRELAVDPFQHACVGVAHRGRDDLVRESRDAHPAAVGAAQIVRRAALGDVLAVDGTNQTTAQAAVDALRQVQLAWIDAIDAAAAASAGDVSGPRYRDGQRLRQLRRQHAGPGLPGPPSAPTGPSAWSFWCWRR